MSVVMSLENMVSVSSHARPKRDDEKRGKHAFSELLEAKPTPVKNTDSPRHLVSQNRRLRNNITGQTISYNKECSLSAKKEVTDQEQPKKEVVLKDTTLRAKRHHLPAEEEVKSQVIPNSERSYTFENEDAALQALLRLNLNELEESADEATRQALSQEAIFPLSTHFSGDIASQPEGQLSPRLSPSLENFILSQMSGEGTPYVSEDNSPSVVSPVHTQDLEERLALDAIALNTESEVYSLASAAFNGKGAILETLQNPDAAAPQEFAENTTMATMIPSDLVSAAKGGSHNKLKVPSEEVSQSDFLGEGIIEHGDGLRADGQPSLMTLINSKDLGQSTRVLSQRDSTSVDSKEEGGTFQQDLSEMPALSLSEGRGARAGTHSTRAQIQREGQFASLLREENKPLGQVLNGIHSSFRNGIQRYTVKLLPEELGTVDVKLEFAKNGPVSILIQVEKPSTLELLEQDASTLKQALADAGIQAESQNLNFSLNQEQRDDHQSSHYTQRSSHQLETFGTNLEEQPDQEEVLIESLISVKV